jgi:hypothetical protein
MMLHLWEDTRTPAPEGRVPRRGCEEGLQVRLYQRNEGWCECS